MKLTITEPQMEPQGGRVLLLPEALANSGLKEGLKLSGCEDHSRVFMAAVQKKNLLERKISRVYDGHSIYF